jgi:hypothetical protein
MAFTLDKVVPWGRSFDEYVAMFALSKSDLQKRVLSCSDGPASFNAVLTNQGGSVISADPLYAFSVAEIQKRIDETFEVVLEQTRINKNEFLWRHFVSVDELAEARRGAMNMFLNDYDEGRRMGRYVEAGLPVLPFKDKVFDLAVCSHFLFLYSELFSEDFHILSIQELCRVANEVRVFPLLELGSRPSRHLESVLATLEEEDFGLVIQTVNYEFQKNGYQMLKVYPADVT